MSIKNTLPVSETFYSLQGEGADAGCPAVFLRLSGCNLRCPGFTYRDPKTGEHLGCDTLKVWQKHKKMSFDAILALWDQNGWLQRLNAGAHLIITGGEPTLHQRKLISFIEQLDSVTRHPCIIEVETNATQLLQSAFLRRVSWFNASPKLSHAGEPPEKARVPEVLAQLAASAKTRFKFVVRNRADVAEIFENYVQIFSIDPGAIWLMPEGGSRSAIREKYRAIAELCIEHGLHFSPRLHIELWDEATGV